MINIKFSDVTDILRNKANYIMDEMKKKHKRNMEIKIGNIIKKKARTGEVLTEDELKRMSKW